MPEETPKPSSAAVIALLFSALTETLALIGKYKQAAQQAGEWTPEQEAAYKARRDALMADPAWQIQP